MCSPDVFHLNYGLGRRFHAHRTPRNWPKLLPMVVFRDLVRRRFVTEAAYAEPVDLSGKKVIVTGATPGSLGFETARTLASWGASVVVTTRSNPEAAVEALRGVCSMPMRADESTRMHSIFRTAIRSPASCDGLSRPTATGSTCWSTTPASTWTCCLAGKSRASPMMASRFSGARTTSAPRISRICCFRCSRRRASRPATRESSTSSPTCTSKGSNDDLFETTRPYNSWTAYGNSKLALVHMTTELQRRYANRVSLAGVLSASRARCSPTWRPRGSRGPGWSRRCVMPSRPSRPSSSKRPKKGAQTQIHCATQPQLRGGLYYEECQPSEASKDAAAAEVAARLWSETGAWVGLREARGGVSREHVGQYRRLVGDDRRGAFCRSAPPSSDLPCWHTTNTLTCRSDRALLELCRLGTRGTGWMASCLRSSACSTSASGPVSSDTMRRVVPGPFGLDELGGGLHRRMRKSFGSRRRYGSPPRGPLARVARPSRCRSSTFRRLKHLQLDVDERVAVRLRCRPRAV